MGQRGIWNCAGTSMKDTAVYIYMLQGTGIPTCCRTTLLAVTSSRLLHLHVHVHDLDHSNSSAMSPDLR